MTVCINLDCDQIFCGEKIIRTKLRIKRFWYRVEISADSSSTVGIRKLLCRTQFGTYQEGLIANRTNLGRRRCKFIIFEALVYPQGYNPYVHIDLIIAF